MTIAACCYCFMRAFHLEDRGFTVFPGSIIHINVVQLAQADDRPAVVNRVRSENLVRVDRSRLLHPAQ